MTCNNAMFNDDQIFLFNSLKNYGGYMKGYTKVTSAQKGKKIDITGQKFGALTAIRFDHYHETEKSKYQVWLFKCDCGEEILAGKNSVRYGNITRCKSCAGHIADPTGKKFGHLTAIKNIKHQIWLFECDCGNFIEKKLHLVVSKSITQCRSCTVKKLQTANITHNESNSRLYRIWKAMKTRCSNKNIRAWKWYGALGIKVCDDWANNYTVFRDWAISNGYNDNLTIDRIDSTGNYEPTNCRWITQKEQVRNTKQNVLITYKSETHCLGEWAEILGINKWTLYRRYEKNGNVPEKLFKGCDINAWSAPTD